MRSTVSGSSGIPEDGKEREPMSGGVDTTEGASGVGAGRDAGADIWPGAGPASVPGVEAGGGSGAGTEAEAGSDALLDLVLDLVPADATDRAFGAASASVSVPAGASAAGPRPGFVPADPPAPGRPVRHHAMRLGPNPAPTGRTACRPSRCLCPPRLPKPSPYRNPNRPLYRCRNPTTR